MKRMVSDWELNPEFPALAAGALATELRLSTATHWQAISLQL